MPPDELGSHPNRIMIACSGNAVEGIIELQFGSPVLVVLKQEHGLADDCLDGTLVLFW